MQRLLHRWFVQYNPLYLVSALLVLGGMLVTSRGIAAEGSVLGELGVAAIAELYALALIGGAGLLRRIGQPRPAVMLALLTALYQGDLTLHTETCVNLGALASWATSLWMILFVVKLYALAWAMKVHVRIEAMLVVIAGGGGLATLPYLLRMGEIHGSTVVVGAWLVALVLLAPRAAVTSTIPLDVWGATVLRRTVTAIWALWGVILGGHVLFWSSEHRIQVVVLVPALILAATRSLEKESNVWAVIGATLVIALLGPKWFAFDAFVAALVLVLRAVDTGRAAMGLAPLGIGRAATTIATGPYRAGIAATLGEEAELDLDPAGLRAAAFRYAMGGAFAIYLALWSAGWSGGHWPRHIVWLDVLLVLVVATTSWRAHLRAPLAPLAVTIVDLVVESRVIPTPHGATQWGATAVAFGFALLLGSLAVSYRLRPRDLRAVTPRSSRLDPRAMP